jgi:hypothetical protein
MTIDKMKAFVEARRREREQEKLHDWTGQWSPRKVVTYLKAMCLDVGGKMEVLHLAPEDEVKFSACYKAWLRELDERNEDPGVFFMDLFLFHFAISVGVMGYRCGWIMDLMEIYRNREHWYKLLRKNRPVEFFDHADPWAVLLFLSLDASGRYRWIMNERPARYESFDEAVERAENLGRVEYLDAHVPQCSPFSHERG